MQMILGISGSAMVPGATYDFAPQASARYVESNLVPDLNTAKSVGAWVQGSAGALSVDGQHTYGDVDGHKYRYRSSFASFDTSVLAGKTIITAALSVSVSSLNYFGETCQLRAYNFGPTVDLADFHAPTETILATCPFTSTGTKTFTAVGSNLINAINKTGITYFMFSVPSHTSGQPAVPDNTSGGGNFGFINLKVTT